MKKRNELAHERALDIAADYLVSEGFCTLESVSECQKKYNEKLCRKCVKEMMLHLGRMEADVAIREKMDV